MISVSSNVNRNEFSNTLIYPFNFTSNFDPVVMTHILEKSGNSKYR